MPPTSSSRQQRSSMLKTGSCGLSLAPQFAHFILRACSLPRWQSARSLVVFFHGWQFPVKPARLAKPRCLMMFLHRNCHTRRGRR